MFVIIFVQIAVKYRRKKNRPIPNSKSTKIVGCQKTMFFLGRFSFLEVFFCIFENNGHFLFDISFGSIFFWSIRFWLNWKQNIVFGRFEIIWYLGTLEQGQWIANSIECSSVVAFPASEASDEGT